MCNIWCRVWWSHSSLYVEQELLVGHDQLLQFAHFFAFFLHCSAFFCFLGWCFFWTGANSQRHEKNCMWIGTIIRRSHQSPLDEDAIVRFRCICSAAFANAFFPCAEHVLHVTASAMLSACEAASTKHDVSARFAWRVCLIYCTHQKKHDTIHKSSSQSMSYDDAYHSTWAFLRWCFFCKKMQLENCWWCFFCKKWQKHSFGGVFSEPPGHEHHPTMSVHVLERLMINVLPATGLVPVIFLTPDDAPCHHHCSVDL